MILLLLNCSTKWQEISLVFHKYHEHQGQPVHEGTEAVVSRQQIGQPTSVQPVTSIVPFIPWREQGMGEELKRKCGGQR